MRYLDYAATTPVDPRVFDKMAPYFTELFANPSSAHPCAKAARDAVKASRKKMTSLMGADDPDEIIFTSGASESNNLAIKGVAECYDEPVHFITSSFEHKAALNAATQLKEWGHSVTLIRPNEGGVVSVSDVESAIRPNTVLCSIMHVNNEIGTIQPIDDIARICKKNGVLFHTDATQSFGKMPVRATGDIDMISISAHKFYGPKGIGLLYCAKDVPIVCQISGGSQENGMRAGTTNVPGIVGIAEAAQMACGSMREEYERLSELQDAFVDVVKNEIPMAYMQGDPTQKVPWICNIAFYGVEGAKVRDMLGERDFCVSRSSACAKMGTRSHVLDAIGAHDDLATAAVRFSFGRFTKKQDVVDAAKETACIVTEIRGS